MVRFYIAISMLKPYVSVRGNNQSTLNAVVNALGSVADL